MRKLRKLQAKVTCESYETCKSYESYRQKLRAKIRRCLFYGITAGAGVRQKKKNYKKDLQSNVNRDIMDSNKEAT